MCAILLGADRGSIPCGSGPMRVKGSVEVAASLTAQRYGRETSSDHWNA